MEGDCVKSQVLAISQRLVNDDPSLALRKALHLLDRHHGAGCGQYDLCADWADARAYFLTGPYEELAATLLTRLEDVEYFQAHASDITAVLSSGPLDITLEVLGLGLAECGSALLVDRCIRVLTQIVTEERVSELLSTRCQLDQCDAPLFDGRNDHLLQVLVTLPDRVANRLHQQVPTTLTRTMYNSILYKSILSALNAVRLRLSQGLPSSVLFISQLVGKLCLHGNAIELWRTLLADIMISQDFLISRVFHKLITKVPVVSLEPCVAALMCTIHHYQDVSALLGNTVIENKRLEFLLLDKMILHRCYPAADCHRLLYNIVGYLATSPTRVSLYHDLFVKLLSVWSDSSSIRHVSYDQHMYMSRALVVCDAFHTAAMPADVRQTLMKKLMTGLQNHLSSSDASLRHIGMAVAELLSDKLNPGLEEKLRFSYDSEEELNELKAMRRAPDVPRAGSYRLDSADLAPAAAGSRSSGQPEPTAPRQAAEELDSDDDLEPLGEFEDRVRVGERPPAYLADCMAGLLDSEKPERVEVCLRSAPSLIRSSGELVNEVAVEFARALLHMTDSLAVDGYHGNRHKSLVSLIVVSPISVCEYLCEQFSARNYSVSQRLLILDTLTDAASELSEVGAEGDKKISEIDASPDSAASKDWRAIVDQRIEAKTRRFASATKQPTESPNRFSKVAGHFFFPLLRTLGVMSASDYNPLMSDSMLLVQYLNSLGKIIGSAINCPIANKMSQEMFSLIWQLRGSRDPSVRKAVLFCLAMTLFVLHPFQLVTQFQQQVSEIKDWLSDMVEREAEHELQKMAAKIISYLLASVKQGLESLEGTGEQ